ncbi:hypothetical protein Cpar_0124 [Chlorobaculum parvum NCIB 8327]|uniref:HAMP domain-containing histidine kinase n=1 Tax=Chlorobaculum parvum (strain DSM 263 / NCIMB 8327) TaxID=517417 RepID=B3QRN0_CHLP8|nr:hypothetical protein [Chlorobaculum parvum]ACF10552.1 hypothetical protein Cpar_0124 [Chlorobaculum parvum NCIB 8327]
MQEKYTAISDSDPRKNDFRNLLIEEEINARREMGEIHTLVTRVLEKSRNPFLPNAIDNYDLDHLLATCRFVYQSIFGRVPSVNVCEADDFCLIQYDADVMRTALYDILYNAKKSGKGEPVVDASCENGYLTLRVKNMANCRDEDKAMIKGYNQGVRSEIMKRSSSGLSIIYELLSNMSIKSEIDCMDGFFIFKIIIPVSHESTNR